MVYRETREASHSGLVHHVGNVAVGKPAREFKSLRLRRYFLKRYSVLENTSAVVYSQAAATARTKRLVEVFLRFAVARILRLCEWAPPIFS